MAAGTFLLAAAALARADESLARFVPPEVGLFVELRDAGDLLVPLVEPQVWLTVAELAGQPAALPEAEQWRKRIEDTVNMSPAEAVLTLFSRRVAFVGEGLRRTQDAVILSRPLRNTHELLSRWKARPLPSTGRASVYRLPNNVGVAIRDNLFIFGDSSAPGMFERVLTQVEDNAPASLADDADYRKLLARVPPNPDGVCFIRLSSALPTSVPTTSTPATVPVSQPARPRAPELPRLLRGSSNVLFALHREKRLVHVSAVGDAPAGTPAPDGALDELVATLPQRTLVAWAGQVDYVGLGQIVTGLPEMSVFRLAYQVHEKAGTVQRLTAALEPSTCIALGAVTRTSREFAAPAMPAIAILIATRDPAAAARNWSDLFHTTLDLYRLLSLKLATPPRIGPPTTIDLSGVPVEQLDLSNLIGTAQDMAPLGELHVSWTIDDGVLIIASHSDWLRQILEARHEQAPELSSVLDLAPQNVDGRQATIFVAQSGPLADLGGLWLRYLEQIAPQVLKESWWRNYQPRGAEPQLGIQVTEDAAGQRLRVQSVTPNTPADGILKPGDEIIGCHPRRFATSQPIQEIKRGVRHRPSARWVDLIVKRDRAVRVRRIPLPFVDPVELLRRIMAIGRVVQRVVYLDDIPDAAGASGRLTLELRTDREPLYQFTVSTPATSAVASAPAPAPPATHPAGLVSPALEPPPPATTSAPAPTSAPASAPAVPPTTAPTPAPVAPPTTPSPTSAPVLPPTTAPTPAPTTRPVPPPAPAPVAAPTTAPTPAPTPTTTPPPAPTTAPPPPAAPPASAPTTTPASSQPAPPSTAPAQPQPK